MKIRPVLDIPLCHHNYNACRIDCQYLRYDSEFPSCALFLQTLSLTVTTGEIVRCDRCLGAEVSV